MRVLSNNWAHSRPVLMGILNCTPDSFSDGGQFVDVDLAVQHALAMLADGADIIDIGGESTRPGALPVSVGDEIARVIPVIQKLKQRANCFISIDTHKPEVMTAAIEAGADIINDVNALRTPGALQAAAASNARICLMHMQGQPQTMQEHPHYDDLLAEVLAFFDERITACVNAGIARERLIIDPGFGFGKSVDHNLLLIQQLAQFKQFGLPILVGVSRKSTIGHVLDRDVNERLPGSLALTTLALCQGASIIRAHDVKETKDVINMTHAVMQVAKGTEE